MKKNLLFLVYFLTFFLHYPGTCISQNLVPNGSFEIFTSCPVTNSGIDLAPPWHVPPGSGTTPDYFNSCQIGASGCSLVDVPGNFVGTAPAANGNAYSGIIFIYDFCLDCREYIQTTLTSPLVAGTEYLVYMYIRPGDYNNYMTNNQGIFISDYEVSQPSNQPITSVTPQIENLTVISDTSQWTLVSGTYVAAGGEEYITIGNFHNNLNTEVETVNYPGGSCVLVTAGSMYMIDSVYVGIANAAPHAAFSVLDSAICQMTCVDFTDASANNPTSWQWSFPGATPGTSADQHPANICYNSGGLFDVTLIATNAAGSDTITLSNFINVNALAAATITQSNDTLYASSGIAYQWFTGGNNIAGATNSFYVPVSEAFYTVIITDSNGCAAADTLFFSFAPQASFSVLNPYVCQKFCLDFSDQSGNNPTQWAWSFESGSPSISSLQHPGNICYNLPGMYNVMLISSNAFGSDTLLLSDYITVYATPPIPLIVQDGFTLTSSEADFYQWLLNTVEIPGATNQSFEVNQSGFYTVEVSDSNGCKNSASVNILISGMEDSEADAFLTVHPNPSGGYFIVEYSGALPEEDCTIEILNAIGVSIFVSVEKSAALIRREIDISNQPAGMYFLLLSSGERRMLRKVIIDK